MKKLPVVPLLALALVACGPSGNATYTVQPSLEQIYVTHATEGQVLVLVDRKGNELARGEADYQGSLVFRKVEPGEKYRVITEGVDPAEKSEPFEVKPFEGSQPEPSFYQQQEIGPGYNYIKMRDGTLLSAYVVLPGPPEDGPYPTLVNYSGYAPSKPGEPLDEGLSALCDDYPVICDAPNHPSGLIGGMVGYATVGVNMRGTGCSGGAYDYFEQLQVTDAYDVIEAIAAQPWVFRNRVGMAGLSYPGISQMFAAKANPPSLAAITPLSVVGNTATTMLPGGILNNGFALEWIENVLDKANPYGQGWEQGMVDAGDTICEEHQLLHSQLIDVIQKIRDTPFYVDEVVDPLNPEKFVDEIDVPVFLASAFQDEQTGPGFWVLLDKFKNSPDVHLNIYNGVHLDGYAPMILTEWTTFLNFYVADDIIAMDPLLENLAPELFRTQFDVTLELHQPRFDPSEDLDTALAAYQAEDDLRVIFEAGANPNFEVGAPEGSFEATFPSWPVAKESDAMRLFFQPDGTLGSAAPTDAQSASRYAPDKAESQRGIVASGSGIWDPVPVWDWVDDGAGKSVAFESAAMTEDVVMLGTASADLWVRSSFTDADLEVTLTEVRPDGKETYIQNGWLRISRRALADHSTALAPAQTHYEDDAQPLTPGEWVEARIVIEGFAHVFRAGSKVRVIVDAPGGSRARWFFETVDWPVDTTVDIGHDASRPSSILLPVIKGVTPVAEYPPCPGLRGQMCRDHVAFVNDAATF